MAGRWGPLGPIAPYRAAVIGRPDIPFALVGPATGDGDKVVSCRVRGHVGEIQIRRGGSAVRSVHPAAASDPSLPASGAPATSVLPLPASPVQPPHAATARSVNAASDHRTWLSADGLRMAGLFHQTSSQARDYVNESRRVWVPGKSLLGLARIEVIGSPRLSESASLPVARVCLLRTFAEGRNAVQFGPWTRRGDSF